MARHFASLDGSCDQPACRLRVPCRLPGLEDRCEAHASSSELIMAPVGSIVVFGYIRGGRVSIFNPGNEIICQRRSLGLNLDWTVANVSLNDAELT